MSIKEEQVIEPKRLKGKVVIVTGGGHGIGKAYAKHLAICGANVIVAEVLEDACIDINNEMKDSELNIQAIQTDITNKDSLLQLVDRTIEQYGKIDALINNAAIFSTIPISRVPFDQVSEEEWDLVMNVNVKGTWLACQAVVPHMKKQQKGKIITIASGTAFHGNGGRIHYVSSKAAILGFTKTLARELGEYNITVNCIAPGGTLSEEKLAETMLKHRESNASTRALKRVQTPDDLIGTIEFLCSDGSDFITGQTIVVDGGNYMH